MALADYFSQALKKAAQLGCLFVFFISGFTYAESTGTDAVNATSTSQTPFPSASGQIGSGEQLISMLASLIVVVLIILVMAYFVKKLNPQIGGHQDFKVIRSLSLGAKERLLVVEIDGAQHLLGVTPQAINYLYELKTPLKQQDMPQLAASFARLMKQQKE